LQLCSFAGWWCSERSSALLEDLLRESVFETRYEIWEQLQQAFYEEAALIKLGDLLDVNARSPLVQGHVTQTQIGPILWNVWLGE